MAPQYAQVQMSLMFPLVLDLSEGKPAQVRLVEQLSAPLIEAAPAWPAWLAAVLQAVESGPADVAEEVEGERPLLPTQ